MLKTIAAVLIIIGSTILAAAEDGDDNTTPVPVCANMPSSAVLGVYSVSEVQQICRAMGLLDGVRVKDIRTFSKAIFMMSREGDEDGAADIAKQLVEIVRLRGLYDKPDRWESNLDIVARSYVAFNGVVTPRDAIAFLATAGPMAKTLSDKGFGMMLIYIKERKQQGN